MRDNGQKLEYGKFKHHIKEFFFHHKEGRTLEQVAQRSFFLHVMIIIYSKACSNVTFVLTGYFSFIFLKFRQGTECFVVITSTMRMLGL